MKDISECIKTQGNIVLYAPESFEWLLLSTKEIPEVKVETILQNPEEYIDSKEYVSWERYFTDLLIESTSKNFIWAYSKKKAYKGVLCSKNSECGKNNHEIGRLGKIILKSQKNPFLLSYYMVY
ncbi:hypothetical protein M5E86_13250 [Blautia wexlerae]|nr:hypothetical protein M5E86_13250 [Blautia wexlerae]